MTPISGNGRRSTGSKRKSVNPILPGDMVPKLDRGFGLFLVSATISMVARERGRGYVGSSDIARQDLRVSLRSCIACPVL